MSSSHNSLGPLLGAFVLAGCAATVPGAGPEDMSASARREAADEHAAKAAGSDTTPPGDGSPQARKWRLYGLGTYGSQSGFYADPELARRRIRDRHRRHALAHRNAAQALESGEAAACASVPKEAREVCPLIGTVTSSELTPRGVRFRLPEDVDVDAVLAAARCHAAVARVRGHVGMPHCPLYVNHVRVDRDDGERAIRIDSDDPASVSEIQSRTHSVQP